MGRVWPLVHKELLQVRRDPRTLAVALFFPSLLLVLFGYAITLDIKNIPLAIIDRDRSQAARELAAQLTNSGYFTLVSGKDTDTLLARGKIRVAVEIPADFSVKLSRGEIAPVQILVDGADSNTATIALGYLEGIIETYSARLLRERLAKRVVFPSPWRTLLRTETRVWFNPELRSTFFITPGIVGLIMMVMGVGLTSMAIVREWERGTIEGILASPVRPLELVVGKLLPYGFIALTDIALVLLTAIFLFHLPFRGSLITLTILTLLFLSSALGLGLFISTLVRSQQAAWMISLLSTLLPSIIFSGFIFPLESMPPAIRLISYLLPLRYFLLILRGVMLKGVGIQVLLPQAAALALFTLMVVLLSAWRLKKTVD